MAIKIRSEKSLHKVFGEHPRIQRKYIEKKAFRKSKFWKTGLSLGVKDASSD